jgi:hypothetical protein
MAFPVKNGSFSGLEPKSRAQTIFDTEIPVTVPHCETVWKCQIVRGLIEGIVLYIVS